MTPAPSASAVSGFRPKDAVRLLDPHGDLPSGAVGRVVGCFARAEPTYVVSFSEGELSCVEVREDEIALVADAPTAV